jgi:malate:Na+ symporter
MQANTTGQSSAAGEAALPQSRAIDEGFWPKGWWQLLDFRIGIIPLPVYLLLVVLIAGFAIEGSVPSEALFVESTNSQQRE